MSEAKRTPLPWKIGDMTKSGAQYSIEIGNESCAFAVGTLSCIGPNNYTNNFSGDVERCVELLESAELIVRACNSHNALLAYAECGEAMERWSETNDDAALFKVLGGHGFTGQKDADPLDSLRRFLNDMRRAAIQLAKGDR
jgi:hypothetical protein